MLKVKAFPSKIHLQTNILRKLSSNLKTIYTYISQPIHHAHRDPSQTPISSSPTHHHLTVEKSLSKRDLLRKYTMLMAPALHLIEASSRHPLVVAISPANGNHSLQLNLHQLQTTIHSALVTATTRRRLGITIKILSPTMLRG